RNTPDRLVLINIDTTAVALLALAEERTQPAAVQALDWLRQACVECPSAYSLAWSALALLMHDDPALDGCIAGLRMLHADRYSDNLDDLVYDGLRLFNLDVRRKSVLLKPNIVEYIPGRPVNTDTHLIGAAAEAFLRLDAASVTVGQGPGHHRDTDLLLYETGLGDQLARRKIAFVDLNRDELIKTKLQANYSGLGYLWLPRTVLASDFIVSMPKVKTHHWTGVTLSMKNMFGIVPGSRYGWPKNVLHWAGIHESILDICATV